MKKADNVTHRKKNREGRKVPFKLQVLVNQMARGSYISPAQLTYSLQPRYNWLKSTFLNLIYI